MSHHSGLKRANTKQVGTKVQAYTTVARTLCSCDDPLTPAMSNEGFMTKVMDVAKPMIPTRAK